MFRNFGLLFALAILHVGVATAQEQIPIEDLDALIGRDRESMHPGNPLVVVGLEQGDNDFRAATPALGKGEFSATMMDMDALYARRLSMFTEKAQFDTAPAGSKRMTQTEPRRRLDSFQSDRPEVEPVVTEEQDGSSGIILFALAGVLGTCVLLSKIRISFGS